MAIGTVKWFNATKGFGFIVPQDGGKDGYRNIAARVARLLTQCGRTLKARKREKTEDGCKANIVERMTAWREGLKRQAAAGSSPR